MSAGKKQKTNNLDLARKAWGKSLPDWVDALAHACAADGQKKVAARIGKSHSTISLVLNNRYGASLDAIETLVRGHLMNATVICPVIDSDIAIDQCHQNQRWQPTALERRLFRACLTCPNRKGA